MDFKKPIEAYNRRVNAALQERGMAGAEVRFSPRAVLFDMDGVLYDSMPNHAIAWQRMMAAHGIHFTAADSYETEGARGFDTIIQYAKKQLGKDVGREEAERMYAEKARLFHELPEAPIFDGVRELMRKIVDAGLSVNVVTGSGQRPLIHRLEADFQGLLSPDHITTAYDVTRGKPSPDPYLAGLRKAGDLRPWEGIVIENAPLGVRSGVAAGIFTVAINSGPLPDSALAAEGCDLLYGKIADFARDWDDFINSVGA